LVVFRLFGAKKLGPEGLVTFTKPKDALIKILNSKPESRTESAGGKAWPPSILMLLLLLSDSSVHVTARRNSAGAPVSARAFAFFNHLSGKNPALN
jgi:hypothetical protein